MSDIRAGKVRIDKWLWAARFYKTRSLAKSAIDGGKVRVNGERAKASKELEVGMRVSLRQGWDDIEVEILALSDQRRGAPEARLLYRETEASVQQREAHALQRQAMGPAVRADTRPSGKARRQLLRIKREILDGGDD